LDDRTARQGRELMTITIALTGPENARKDVCSPDFR
jgi:hypothetical protein